MDRPTCATCRYFVATDSTGGRCVAMPPRVSGWPVVTDSDSCAVHQDFPAFIESRKATPPDEPSDLEIDGEVTVTRQQFDAVASVIFRKLRATRSTAPPSPPPTPRE